MNSLVTETINYGSSKIYAATAPNTSSPNSHTINPLQTVTLYKHSSAESYPTSWFIFIHGGAWRDPNNSSKDGEPLIAALLNRFPDQLAAASINYRLAKPLVKKTISSSSNAAIETDNDEGVFTKDKDAVMHPDFTKDVLAALLEINDKCVINQFVVAGHSAGAFIAAQLFIKPSSLFSWAPKESLDITTTSSSSPNGTFKSASDLADLDISAAVVMSRCCAIFAIAGIYALPLLTIEDKSYASFIEEAFGKDQHQWESHHVAPYITTKTTLFQTTPRLQLVVIYSPEDELLNEKFQAKEGVHIYRRILDEYRVFEEVTDGKHEDTYKSKKTAEIIEKYLRYLL